MIVEKYSDRWFDDVMRLVENFHNEAVGEYVGESFDPGTVANIIKSGQPDNSFLLIIDGKCEGLLYGQRVKSPTSDKLMFQEMIWFVNEPHRRHGVRLLREVEKSLKLEGISIMIMVVLENSKADKIKKFYERLGYKPMEVQYARSL